MENSKSFYEIELKALLTQEQYDRLLKELPARFQKINEDTIHTTRFRPGDIRLRHSPKILELVCKHGDVTRLSRREVVLPLPSRGHLNHFSDILEMLKFTPDPPWIKHKQEYLCHRDGFDYVICLQHIEKFAYILEVEFLSERDDSDVHGPNLRAIIEELGCEPINPESFSERIKKYIADNKVS